MYGALLSTRRRGHAHCMPSIGAELASLLHRLPVRPHGLGSVTSRRAWYSKEYTVPYVSHLITCNIMPALHRFSSFNIPAEPLVFRHIMCDMPKFQICNNGSLEFTMSGAAATSTATREQITRPSSLCRCAGNVSRRSTIGPVHLRYRLIATCFLYASLRKLKSNLACGICLYYSTRA